MNRQTIDQIHAVAKFIELAPQFKKIGGFIPDLQGYVLYRLARDGEGSGAIVEIGSWMGRSTAWLAAGSKEAGRERVHAVDPFDGGPVLKRMKVVKERGTTYDIFIRNLKNAGLLEHVVPVVEQSRAAAARWKNGPIRLLFIDGDHSYEGVKADVDGWLPHVPAGGYVVFDDVVPRCPGVQRLTAEVTAARGPLKHLMIVGNQVWVTRRR